MKPVRHIWPWVSEECFPIGAAAVLAGLFIMRRRVLVCVEMCMQCFGMANMSAMPVMFVAHVMLCIVMAIVEASQVSIIMGMAGRRKDREGRVGTVVLHQRVVDCC